MKVKNFLNLSVDQVREITKLAYASPDWIKSKIKVYESKAETSNCVFIKIMVAEFQAFTFGDTVDKIHVEINSKLDVFVSYLRMKDGVPFCHGLPLHNQYEIQKRFRDWKIKPEDFKEFDLNRNLV